MAFFRRNRAPQLKVGRVGEARFTGKKVHVVDLPPSRIPTQVIEIGDLIEFVCETPHEANADSFNLIKSKKRPLVVASKKGDLVMIVRSDNIDRNYMNQEELQQAMKTDSNLKTAHDLFEGFHGTPADSLSEVKTPPIKSLIFYGHLNNIVYNVPNTSARKGVPFIHHAKDRGDGVPESRNKPIVCYSPDREVIVMYGSQFEFTERGIIG